MKRDRVVIPEGAPLVKSASARRALDAGVAGGGDALIMGRGPQLRCGPLVAVSRVMGGGELSSLLPWSMARIRSMGVSLRWRNSNKGRHAARTLAAPAGAKGCSVLNMCQMDSAMRRAMSTRAILVPR